jgi:hypothetical protein
MDLWAWIIVRATGLLCLAGGATLLLLGLRGRLVDDHPHCRQCGFDLVGLWGSTSNCPECGSGLGHGKVIHGMRQRRPRFIVVGALLLAICAGISGVRSWARARSFDWNTVKPTMWLLRDARANPPLAQSSQAIRELLSRHREDRLHSAVVEELLKAAIAHHSDTASWWIREWGDVIEQLRNDGFVPDEAWRNYVRNSIPVALTFHRVVDPQPTGRISVEFNIGPIRRGSVAGGPLEIAFEQVTLDGQAFPTGHLPFVSMNWAGYGGRGELVPQFVLPDGRSAASVVILRYRVRLYAAGALTPELIQQMPLDERSPLVPAQPIDEWTGECSLSIQP